MNTSDVLTGRDEIEKTQLAIEFLERSGRQVSAKLDSVAREIGQATTNKLFLSPSDASNYNALLEANSQIRALSSQLYKDTPQIASYV